MEFNGTFLATIISFLLFVFFMNKLLYEPVRKIVNERNDFILGNYKAAEENNNKAQELIAERDEKIVEAKDDARLKYNEILDGFKAQKAEIIKKAQEASKEELNSALANLENVSNEAKNNLKSKMSDIAGDIVEKVLGFRSELNGFDDNKVNEILYH